MKIDKTQKEYLNFEKNITNFNLKFIKLFTKNRILIDNIILLLNNKNIKTIMKNKLKKKIIEKQINIFFSWIHKSLIYI